MGSDDMYRAGLADPSEYGTPDDDNPEWTGDDHLWAVAAADFPSFEASIEFLNRRESLLAAAEAAGVPRAAFLPFEPSKPGFEDRARKAFTALPKALGWAAE